MSTELELDIPQTPETLDPELFKELVRVYNSIQMLAQQFSTIQVGTSVPAAATDLPTALALLNSIRTLLITTKIAT